MINRTTIMNVVVPPLETKRSHIYLTKSNGILCASGEQKNEECRPSDSREFLADFFSVSESLQGTVR